jgi:hypothetical protein
VSSASTPRSSGGSGHWPDAGPRRPDRAGHRRFTRCGSSGRADAGARRCARWESATSRGRQTRSGRSPTSTPRAAAAGHSLPTCRHRRGCRRAVPAGRRRVQSTLHRGGQRGHLATRRGPHRRHGGGAVVAHPAREPGLGLLYTVRRAAQDVADGGSIVMVSSTAGQRGEAFHADYAASKGAMIALTKSVAVELAPGGSG